MTLTQFERAMRRRGWRLGCLLLLCTSLSLAQVNALSAKEKAEGWQLLFDGRSLAGWQPEAGAQWHVAGGAIVGDRGGDGWLRSARRYTNFVLECDFRNVPKGNSGIFLRATKETKSDDPSNPSGGYELQINNEDDKWATGSIENYLQRLVTVNPAPGQWHHYRAEVQGHHLVAYLDAQKVLDGTDASFAAGYLGLQHHKDMRIEFRSIKIKAASGQSGR